jgi:hypothetical protein
MATKKTIRDLLNHPRAEISHVLRAELRDDGTPFINQIARLVTVYPRDGAGRLYVGLTVWGYDSGGGHVETTHEVGHASGYGYDKLTAAMAGMRLRGTELGDHSDHKGRPTLTEALRAMGAARFGS